MQDGFWADDTYVDFGCIELDLFSNFLLPVQNGATRRFRLYAIFSNNFHVETATVIKIQNSEDSKKYIEFYIQNSGNDIDSIIPIIELLYSREGFSQWLEVDESFKEIRTFRIFVKANDNADSARGLFKHLELQIGDFF